MKRKRIFIQNEPLWLVESSFIALLAFGAQLFSIVSFIVELSNGFKNIDRFLGYYLTFLLAPFIVYPMVFSMFSWNVHIDEKKVWMKGDSFAAKWWRIQRPVKVFYSEILSMEIETSTKNSSGQSIRAWFYGPAWSYKRYLVFITNKGKKRIHVSHFTDGTLAYIIDEIATRAEQSGNKYDGKRAAYILFGL